MRSSQIRSLVLTFFFIISFLVTINFPKVWNSPAQAQSQSTFSLPTLTYQVGEQQVLAPDWSRITWSSLPPIEEPGSIQLPTSLVRELGYDPSRSWQALQNPDSVVMLGDVEDSFHLEAFTLQAISDIVQGDFEDVALSALELVARQTLPDLVRAIPGLGELRASSIPAVHDFLVGIGRGGDLNERLADVVSEQVLENLPLGEHIDLGRYNLGSIPGLLENTPLQNFRGWQQSFINQIPGLNQVPFSQFVQPLLNGVGLIGITDLVWGPAENGDPNVGSDYFISGSINRNGSTVPVACQKNTSCPYIELRNLVGTIGSLNGKRWASGVQKVRGGFGPLAVVNSGKEPTGKLLLDNVGTFKVVLTSTNESTGTANFGLYLRVCVRFSFYGRSCTPYFIGPIPWIPTKEGQPVLVGST